MPSRIVDLGSSENLVVVSDVHMRTPDDAQTGNFLSFLESIGSSLKCDTLVLLGDIFDFVNARQSFYFQHWKKVFFQLKALKARGIKVVFVEGNHDFGFEHSPRDEISECFDHCGDILLKIKHPRAGDILLLHSDDVVCPPSYRIFRSLVKSAVFQSLFTPVPGRLTDAIFSRYAKISRSRDNYRVLDPRFLTQCASEFVCNLDGTLGLKPQICVFGHIHVHLDDVLEDIRFLSGPAWLTQPSFLILTDTGAIERKWLGTSQTQGELFKFSNSSRNSFPKPQQ
jgi:UDP-2,3-diacylglucosamine hydrolase